jgi:hypothetical protein
LPTIIRAVSERYRIKEILSTVKNRPKTEWPSSLQKKPGFLFVFVLYFSFENLQISVFWDRVFEKTFIVCVSFFGGVGLKGLFMWIYRSLHQSLGDFPLWFIGL